MNKPIISIEAIKEHFFIQYVETALWSTMAEDCNPLDDYFWTDDLSESTGKELLEQCIDFVFSASSLLPEYFKANSGPDITFDYIWGVLAHDFWLTHNGHGAGFWDRGLGELGDKLTEISKTYGSVDLYACEDCKLYC